MNRKRKAQPSRGRSSQSSGDALGNSMLDPNLLNAAVELIGKEPVGALIEGAFVAASNREALVSELRSFDEGSVASAMEVATDEIIWAISRRALQFAFSGEKIHRSLCLAAVEKIEGKTRPLARKRRKRAA